MKLFTSIRRNWAHHVTFWNKNGVDWRAMTTPEILWLVHSENIRMIKENEPHKLRPYLIEMGDEASLREWDKEQMKSKSNPPASRTGR